MNIYFNNLFPNPEFFEDVFREIFINNPTINLLEDEEEEIVNFLPQPQQQQLPHIPPLNQGDNINNFQIRRRKRRSALLLDNLKLKIHRHFIRFLIKFCNDALEEENLNIPFPFRIHKFLFPYRFYIEFRNFKIKEKTIQDILKLDISRRNRAFSQDWNKKLLEKVEELSPRLTNLFKMNCLELFKYFYIK